MHKTRGEKSEIDNNNLFYRKSFLSCTSNASIFSNETKKIVPSVTLAKAKRSALCFAWRNRSFMYNFALYVAITNIFVTILHDLRLFRRYFVNLYLCNCLGLISKSHRSHHFHRNAELNEGGNGIQFVPLFRRYYLIN